MERLSQLGNFPVDEIKQWFEKRNQIENSNTTSMDKSPSDSDILTKNKNVEENPVPEKKYYCKSCPRSYKLMYNLTLHTRNVHERKQFTEPNNQKNHLEIPHQPKEKHHENYNNTIIDFTRFEFTADQVSELEKLFKLKKHINIFEIEQLSRNGQYYPEAKVQKWFETQRLKENTNNSETFICEFCRKLFKNKNELLYHNDRAHGVSCVFCNKKFTLGKKNAFKK